MTTHTQNPVVTGSSVLAIKYQGGVLMAADTLASYGSLSRFKDVRRMKAINTTTAIGASGEYSDFQYISTVLDDLVIKDESLGDGNAHTSSEIHAYLTRLMYHRRNKFNPLWNALIIVGYENDTSFLGFIDLVGTSFKDNVAASGLGAHMALPLLRKAYRPDLSYQEAKSVLEDAMRVLFYRDGRTINRMQMTNVSSAGVEISEPYCLSTDWSVAHAVAH